MTAFINHLHDVFQEFGEIHCRKMFGGHGVFKEGLMFGLVADEILYLKGDDQTASFFKELGLSRFGYMKGEKEIKMSYYQAPEEIFDDPDEARRWAVRAYEAALRAKKGKPKKRSG